MKRERKVGVYIPQEKQQCGYLTDSVVAEMRILSCRDLKSGYSLALPHRGQGNHYLSPGVEVSSDQLIDDNM